MSGAALWPEVPLHSRFLLSDAVSETADALRHLLISDAFGTNCTFNGNLPGCSRSDPCPHESYEDLWKPTSVGNFDFYTSLGGWLTFQGSGRGG